MPLRHFRSLFETGAYPAEAGPFALVGRDGVMICSPYRPPDGRSDAPGCSSGIGGHEAPPANPSAGDLAELMRRFLLSRRRPLGPTPSIRRS